MKLVFQENPKFGDEQDVTQQIVAIDEHIEKLLAEIKRFEVRAMFSLFVVTFRVRFSRTSRKSNAHALLLRPNTNRRHVCERIMVPINRLVTQRILLNRAHRLKLEGKWMREEHRSFPPIRRSFLFFRHHYSPPFHHPFLQMNRRWSTTVWLAIR